MENQQTVEQEILHESTDDNASTNGPGLMPAMMGYYPGPHYLPYPYPNIPPPPPQNNSVRHPPPNYETRGHQQPMAHFAPIYHPAPIPLGMSLLQPPAVTGLATSGSTASSRGQLIRAMNLKPSGPQSPPRSFVARQNEAKFETPTTPCKDRDTRTLKVVEDAAAAIVTTPKPSPEQTDLRTLPSLSSEGSQEGSLSCSVDVNSETKTTTTADHPPSQPTMAAKSSKSRSKKKDAKWLATLEELKEYKKEYGNCVVPRGYVENPRLASWVSGSTCRQLHGNIHLSQLLLLLFQVAEQRKQYKLLVDNKPSSISQERVDMLNELGFAWNAQEAAWARHLQDLMAFRAETGHCHVPLSLEKYPKLGLWVKEQRRHRTLLKQGKPSHMTAERVEQLDSVGFCWDTHEATWLERLRELKEYKKEHGDCSVPTTYAANPKLGTWVHHQRRQHKKFQQGQECHITQERIDVLNKIGFTWYMREREQKPALDTMIDPEILLSTTTETESTLGTHARDDEKPVSDADSTDSEDSPLKVDSVKRQRQI